MRTIQHKRRRPWLYVSPWDPHYFLKSAIYSLVAWVTVGAFLVACTFALGSATRLRPLLDSIRSSACGLICPPQLTPPPPRFRPVRTLNRPMIPSRARALPDPSLRRVSPVSIGLLDSTKAMPPSDRMFSYTD